MEGGTKCKDRCKLRNAEKKMAGNDRVLNPKPPVLNASDHGCFPPTPQAVGS